ncbi:ABC transporter ATP-binding protein [Nitratiruptor sp. SB155-2]|uniref:ABC transporter ATP-binding protein n=1 Tax=Nitratiruptor sp. (strain SB155-2) TaxID=387092 RepID=UPI0001586FDA|nr:ABC transporter ATP-binding protein [Nitratiruptor sp. SB155-2]BAF70504.1 ABC transporter, ATP-binding protein [Nitratiruptor sp. SB155-2]
MRNLTKIYKLYKKPSDRLVEIFFKTKKHRLFYANKDISFDLHQGETLGIIGVNGAGKSTLLKQIAGVISPTSGEIRSFGRITALLELGTGFNPEFSGRENIYLNGMLIGLSKAEIGEKLQSIIDFSELESFIDEPLKTYSSGMVMRLAFSIAIHSDPSILIVDEALSVGDAHFSAKCTKALKELKEKKLSIIYVSHDLNSLKLLCDRLILLHKGEIAYEGDPESVINKYNFLIAKLNQEEMITDSCNAFGTMEAKITKVTVKGLDSGSSTVTSGETTHIDITIEAKEPIKDKTVGVLIRDRFGQDIFGTNTALYNKTVTLQPDKTCNVRFTLPMNIAPGKYTISVALHQDKTHLDECIHWIDRACEFEVAGFKERYFAGLCRLEPVVEIL